MAIFNSYVKLPEGTFRCNLLYPKISPSPNVPNEAATDSESVTRAQASPGGQAASSNQNG